MLSREIRNTAQYFAARSTAMLLLPPLATAGIAVVLEKYAERVEKLEAANGCGLPEDVINLAELLHQSGVRRGVIPNPKNGGDAA